MAMFSETIMLVTMLFTLAICAPQLSSNGPPSTYRTPANLSYQELLYIVQSRNGNQKGEPPTFLTPCARAILGCCSNNVMNESCSESLNCGAYFFDDNPCDDKFINDALKAARRFYVQFANNVS